MSRCTVHPATADDLDPEEVLELYRAVGWTGYTDRPAVLAAALAGSTHLVVARTGDGVLAGLARVVSDRATIAYLQDVLVHPDQQRRGLGAALITAAFAPFTGVRQQVLLTDDEPGSRAFYTALGWAEVGADEPRLRAYVRIVD